MRIAILGATSQIAKDLIHSCATRSAHELVLFARRVEVLRQWLEDKMPVGANTEAVVAVNQLGEHGSSV